MKFQIKHRFPNKDPNLQKYLLKRIETKCKMKRSKKYAKNRSYLSFLVLTGKINLP